MKQILFRGKSKDTGKWVYGDFRKRSNEETCWIIPKEPEREREEGGYEYIEVEPDTVGQYTTIDDVKERKIFEDDIVYVEGLLYWFEDIGIVTFDERNTGYPAFDISYMADNPESNLLSVYTFGESIIKTIGNIHDNPLLAKKVKDGDIDIIYDEFRVGEVVCPKCGNKTKVSEYDDIREMEKEFMVIATEPENVIMSETECALVMCKRCSRIFGLSI